MNETEKLKSLTIDVEKKVYELNGRDISKTATELKIEFKDGAWSLEVTENLYATPKESSVTE